MWFSPFQQCKLMFGNSTAGFAQGHEVWSERKAIMDDGIRGRIRQEREQSPVEERRTRRIHETKHGATEME